MLGVLLLGFAAGEATGWQFLQTPLARQLEQRLQVPVRMEGDFKLHLLPPARLRVGGLQVGAGGGLADATKTPHLLKARDIEIGWTWGDVWRGWRGQGWRLESLVAAELDARLRRDAQGLASWQLGSQAGLQGQVPQGQDRTAELTDLPRVGRIEVGAGHVAWSDALTDTDLQVEIQGAEGAPADTATADAATANPGYRATVNGRWRALPLRLSLKTGGVLPLVLELEDDAPNAASANAPLFVEGQAGAARVRFDGQAGALLGGRRLDGDLLLAGPSLAKVGEPLNLTLPQTAPFELRGRLAHDAGVWRLSAARASIGRSQLGGDFSYDSRSAPGKLSGRLLGTRLALADLGPAIGAEGKPGERDSAGRRGRVLPQREFDLPSLRAMDADLQVAIDELRFGSPNVEPLRALRARLLLQAGVLRVEGLQANAGGGRFKATTSLDGNATPARWTLDLGFEAVDLATWLTGLRTADAPAAPKGTVAQASDRRVARQADAAPRAWVTGLLSGQAQLRGQGQSTAQILGTLTGRARATLRDGTLSHLATEAAGLDVAQALGVLLRGDRPLPLRCAEFDLDIQQGTARPRVAVVDSGDSTIRVAGQVSLLDETLDLRAVVKPHDFSPLSLRAPITITGSLGQPRVGVEGGKLAGKVLGAAALGAIAGPLAALLPLIDRGEPAGDACAMAPVLKPRTEGAAPAPRQARPSAPLAPAPRQAKPPAPVAPAPQR